MPAAWGGWVEEKRCALIPQREQSHLFQRFAEQPKAETIASLDSHSAQARANFEEVDLGISNRTSRPFFQLRCARHRIENVFLIDKNPLCMALLDLPCSVRMGRSSICWFGGVFIYMGSHCGQANRECLRGRSKDKSERITRPKFRPPLRQ